MKHFVQFFAVMMCMILSTAVMRGQALLFPAENFDYTAGDALKTHSWILNSATSGPVLSVMNGGLTYDGYPGSGIGNSAALVGNGNGTTNLNGEDLYRQFTSEQTSGTIYVSFLLNVTQQPSAADYFFHLSPLAPGGKYQARLYIKSSGAGYQLGISKAGNATSAQYASSVLGLGTTYVVLLKYVIVADIAGTDDYCELYINPSLTGVAPTSYDAKTTDASADAAIGSVMLRQGGVTYNYIQVDGIRAATSWGNLALPVELNSFTLRATGNSAQLSWSTATEVNCRGFEIERRAVISGASSAWKRLGFVEGAGTSSAPHAYSFVDRIADAGTYLYRLKQIDNDGAFAYYGGVEATIGSVRESRLYGNYPNPFNPSTAIRFSVAADGQADMKIFNVLGQEVATVFNGFAAAGIVHEAVFNASSLPSGMYFARLRSNGASDVITMMLMK